MLQLPPAYFLAGGGLQGGSLLELAARVGGSLLEPMQPHFEKLEEQCMNNFRLTVQPKLSSVTVNSLEDQRELTVQLTLELTLELTLSYQQSFGSRCLKR